jgi:hypothetical protein
MEKLQKEYQTKKEEFEENLKKNANKTTLNISPEMAQLKL